MNAFVSAFAPGTALVGRTFGLCDSARKHARTPPRFSMAKSPSVPFMDVPDNLDPDMPGYVGFDPLHISSFLNVKWLQEAEIKHGRVCMLAFVGAVVSEFYTFPWYTDYPKLWIDRHNWGIHNGSMLQILIWCGFFEIMTLPAVIQMVKGESDRQPGYFGLDPLGIMEKDPLAAQKEVKNGRLAMIAISGAIHQAAVSNMNLIEQLQAGNIKPPIF